MDDDEFSELFVRIIMPIAAAGSVFLFAFFVLLWCIHPFMVRTDINDSSYAIFAICTTAIGGLYCFRYISKEFGYFENDEHRVRDIVIFAVIPSIAAAAFVHNIYNANVQQKLTTPQPPADHPQR